MTDEDFERFMEQNRERIYAFAYQNGKHDANGTLMLSKDNPWMMDNVWDAELPILEASMEAGKNKN